MSETNVVNLRGEPVHGLNNPDPDVIKELEEWLARARAGEIIGCAIVPVWHDDAIGTRYCGVISRAQIGGLFALSSRINAAIDEAL